MQKNNAFSLLELSIVLVIIGLIAGGIVAGASMIRAAELRAVITEQQQFLTSVYTFRDKYLGLPGDLKNAGEFWGYPGGSATNCPSTGGTGTETCDGNVDGKIDNLAVTVLDYAERFTFWQHLANAELISGTYTGRTGASNISDHELGSNAPASKLSGAGWTIFHFDSLSGNPAFFDGSYNNSMWFGGELTGGGAPNADILTPAEAWNLDKKTDDGKPATGKVVVRVRTRCVLAADGSALTASAADAAELDAIYDLANEDIGCALLMRNIF